MKNSDIEKLVFDHEGSYLFEIEDYPMVYAESKNYVMFYIRALSIDSSYASMLNGKEVDDLITWLQYWRLTHKDE